MRDEGRGTPKGKPTGQTRGEKDKVERVEDKYRNDEKAVNNRQKTEDG